MHAVSINFAALRIKWIISVYKRIPHTLTSAFFRLWRHFEFLVSSQQTDFYWIFLILDGFASIQPMIMQTI
jgi:hypothetical protein